MRKKYEFGFSLFWVEAGKPNVPGENKNKRQETKEEGRSFERKRSHLPIQYRRVLEV